MLTFALLLQLWAAITNNFGLTKYVDLKVHLHLATLRPILTHQYHINFVFSQYFGISEKYIVTLNLEDAFTCVQCRAMYVLTLHINSISVPWKTVLLSLIFFSVPWTLDKCCDFVHKNAWWITYWIGIESSRSTWFVTAKL